MSVDKRDASMIVGRTVQKPHGITKVMMARKVLKYEEDESIENLSDRRKRATITYEVVDGPRPDHCDEAITTCSGQMWRRWAQKGELVE